ncbi:MAG TPA: STAS domain-containing protein [Roseiflexaceae bacterium]|nr:STAS domain-containing protein [Roseiflexaceae bacterium]
MQQFLAWLLAIDSANEDVRRRGRNLTIMVLGLICTVLLLVPVLLLQPIQRLVFLDLGLAVLIYAGVVALARRGLVSLGALLLILVVTFAVLGAALSTGKLSAAPFFLVLPLLIAGLCLRPWQVWLVLALELASLTVMILQLPISPFDDPDSEQMVFGAYILLAIVGLISFLAARSTSSALDSAQRSREEAEAAAQELSRVNSGLEHAVAERTAALENALREVQSRSDEQARLLETLEQQRLLLRELSVPVIPISESTLIMPLVGALDSTRLRELQDQALRALEHSSARYLVLDITGVPIVDSQVAQGLLTVVQAARLLGAQVMLVGIRPEVAQAIVGLGLDLREMYTASDLQSALTHIDSN